MPFVNLGANPAAFVHLAPPSETPRWQRDRPKCSNRQPPTANRQPPAARGSPDSSLRAAAGNRAADSNPAARSEALVPALIRPAATPIRVATITKGEGGGLDQTRHPGPSLAQEPRVEHDRGPDHQQGDEKEGDLGDGGGVAEQRPQVELDPGSEQEHRDEESESRCPPAQTPWKPRGVSPASRPLSSRPRGERASGPRKRRCQPPPAPPPASGCGPDGKHGPRRFPARRG